MRGQGRQGRQGSRGALGAGVQVHTNYQLATTNSLHHTPLAT
ncbi:hypothetical protein [Chroococcidiopsis cubana]|nr:hypothetical protein [Chroococcidiopsis cubana]